MSEAHEAVPSRHQYLSVFTKECFYAILTFGESYHALNTLYGRLLQDCFYTTLPLLTSSYTCSEWVKNIPHWEIVERGGDFVPYRITDNERFFIFNALLNTMKETRGKNVRDFSDSEFTKHISRWMDLLNRPFARFWDLESLETFEAPRRDLLRHLDRLAKHIEGLKKAADDIIRLYADQACADYDLDRMFEFFSAVSEAIRNHTSETVVPHEDILFMPTNMRIHATRLPRASGGVFVFARTMSAAMQLLLPAFDESNRNTIESMLDWFREVKKKFEKDAVKTTNHSCDIFNEYKKTFPRSAERIYGCMSYDRWLRLIRDTRASIPEGKTVKLVLPNVLDGSMVRMAAPCRTNSPCERQAEDEPVRKGTQEWFSEWSKCGRIPRFEEFIDQIKFVRNRNQARSQNIDAPRRLRDITPKDFVGKFGYARDRCYWLPFLLVVEDKKVQPCVFYNGKEPFLAVAYRQDEDSLVFDSSSHLKTVPTVNIKNNEREHKEHRVGYCREENTFILKTNEEGVYMTVFKSTGELNEIVLQFFEQNEGEISYLRKHAADNAANMNADVHPFGFYFASHAQSQYDELVLKSCVLATNTEGRISHLVFPSRRGFLPAKVSNTEGFNYPKIFWKDTREVAMANAQQDRFVRLFDKSKKTSTMCLLCNSCLITGISVLSPACEKKSDAGVVYVKNLDIINNRVEQTAVIETTNVIDHVIKTLKDSCSDKSEDDPKYKSLISTAIASSEKDVAFFWEDKCNEEGSAKRPKCLPDETLSSMRSMLQVTPSSAANLSIEQVVLPTSMDFSQKQACGYISQQPEKSNQILSDMIEYADGLQMSDMLEPCERLKQALTAREERANKRRKTTEGDEDTTSVHLFVGMLRSLYKSSKRCARKGFADHESCSDPQ